MNKEQILKEINRIKGWEIGCGLQIAICMKDYEIATYVIGFNDGITFDDDNDSIRLWCIDGSNVVPTMIRIVYEDVKSINYYTPDEVNRMHGYECDLIVIELNNGISIELNETM